MKALAARTPPVVAGESAVAGLAALLLAAREPFARTALALDESSRVLLFGTEGATDAEVYERLVGKSPGMASSN
jgi:diaminopropionate ammonia-lyase